MPAGAVHVTTFVRADAAACFDAFTRHTHLWWRRAPRFRFQREGPEGALAFEPRVGGAVVERLDDGAERRIGEVVAWEPPLRFLFTWSLPRGGTEVEVRFDPEGDGTRVSVTHDGFEPLEPADRNLFGIRWGELLVAAGRASAPRSPRLIYRRLRAGDLDAFHALLVDPHVRRYLLDGEIMDRAFAEAAIEDSDALFDARGLGLWLLHSGAAPVGFAGFRVFPELSAEPQLIYGLTEAHTGQGLATEAARAVADFALAGRMDALVAAVDEPNVASVRVLEKAGFIQTGVAPGAFGQTLLFARAP